MPGTRDIQDQDLRDVREIQEIEIILDDIGGGRGHEPPVAGSGGGGDRNRPGGQPEMPAARKYQTAIGLAMVSILIFFMAMASAFLVRKTASDWIPTQLPAVIWVNTLLLLASSGTMELARRRLVAGDSSGFRKLWKTTTVLGVLFLAGQLVAWRQLVAQGVYVATNPGSSFFYIFTAAHGIHVIGGICALLYVLLRNFGKTKMSRELAAEVTSYYWHFMDGLWVFLVLLLWLGD
jgi:cytochrome c oxidase subunit 3